MGIASWALGDDNPFAKYVADNKNLVHGAFAGLGQGKTFGQGLGNAALYAQQGGMLDTIARKDLAAEAKQAEQTNVTRSWLEQQGFTDLVPLVDAGQADIAYGEALKRMQPGYGQGPTPEPFTLGAGETRYGPNGEVIAQGAPDQGDAFGNEKDLWGQYSNADPVKVYEAVKGGYQRVYQGAQLDSGAGDMSVIYGFMKMNDPGSVVRESEFEMAAKSGSLGEQIQGFVNQIASGQRLDPEVRQRMVEAAAKLYDETSSDLSGINSQFTDRATQYGVNPANVIRQPEAFAPLPGVGNGPPRRTSSGVNWSL